MKKHFHSDPTAHQARLFQKGTHYLLRIVFWAFDHGAQQFLVADKFSATGNRPRHLPFFAT